MTVEIEVGPIRHPEPADHESREPARRAPYVPPVLERLGPWSTVTLQQSIPISPDILL